MNLITTSLSFAHTLGNILTSIPTSAPNSSLDKETKNQIQYIDIKSSGLRDVLRKVLQDVQGICLHEEMPSVYLEPSPRNPNLVMIANWVQVEQNLLYYYLSDLEDCRQDTNLLVSP
jgi:hypothetical protein